MTAAEAADPIIGGISVPPELLSRIAAALRGTYPDLIGDETDPDVIVQIITREWVTSLLVSWERTATERAFDAQLNALQDQRRADADKAAEKACKDIAKITKRAKK